MVRLTDRIYPIRSDTDTRAIGMTSSRLSRFVNGAKLTLSRKTRALRQAAEHSQDLEAVSEGNQPIVECHSARFASLCLTKIASPHCTAATVALPSACYSKHKGCQRLLPTSLNTMRPRLIYLILDNTFQSLISSLPT